MLIVSPSTATALAPHARDNTWVMFVQASSPSSSAIKIELVTGRNLGVRLNSIARDCPFETMLIGLATSPQPAQLAEQVAAQFADDHMHDGWFESSPALIGVVQAIGQHAMQELLSSTMPGAVSSDAVDADEMARLLDCSVPTVRRMVQRGQIPCMRSGRVLRFVPADVFASLRLNR